MNDHFQSIICQTTGATSIQEVEMIQELWSGYGKILRVGLKNASVKNVVVKLVQLSHQNHHPRGWNSDLGHQRKLKSYQVETTWYKKYSNKSTARLPKCWAVNQKENEVLMVLEDLDEAGFPLRKKQVSWQDVNTCLAWLAHFHASFMGCKPEGLWETGTYWHLGTRPEELVALEDKRLKEAAPLIDRKLNDCRFKTFVHGDAKLANFCFSRDGQVAGVDFQYVGGGCGMKDVAYFIGSCLSEDECEKHEAKILDTYFLHLARAMQGKNEALENEWRALYPFAWADFHRFLKGWSPGHWKINGYSERLTYGVIESL